MSQRDFDRYGTPQRAATALGSVPMDKRLTRDRGTPQRATAVPGTAARRNVPQQSQANRPLRNDSPWPNRFPAMA